MFNYIDLYHRYWYKNNNENPNQLLNMFSIHQLKTWCAEHMLKPYIIIPPKKNDLQRRYCISFTRITLEYDALSEDEMKDWRYTSSRLQFKYRNYSKDEAIELTALAAKGNLSRESYAFAVKLLFGVDF